MHMFRIKRAVNLMKNVKSAFFLVLVNSQKCTDCTILSPGKLSLVAMCFFNEEQFWTSDENKPEQLIHVDFDDGEIEEARQ